VTPSLRPERRFGFQHKRVAALSPALPVGEIDADQAMRESGLSMLADARRGTDRSRAIGHALAKLMPTLLRFQFVKPYQQVGDESRKADTPWKLMCFHSRIDRSPNSAGSSRV
jgi:hypothetical protein